MEAVTLLSLAALVVKIVSVIKGVGKNNNMVITQVLTWGVGILVLLLAASADITETLVPFQGGPALGDMDAASLVIAGLSLASLGSFAYDYKKAIDDKDSAAEPRLLQ